MEEKKFYLTKKGLERLKKEYEELKSLKIAKVKEGSPQTWHSEDLSSEYLSFQDDLDSLEKRMAEIEAIIDNYEIIKVPLKKNQDKVGLGATVTLEEKDGHINEFTIVGTLEANPLEGKISSESPVGKVLMGLKVGDEAVIESPIKMAYKIKKVKYRPSNNENIKN